MIKKVLAFADGENLVFRYQEMVKAGRTPNAGVVVHERDAFVLSTQISLWSQMDLVRVTYYTSIVGSDERVAELRTKIAATRHSCHAGELTGSWQITPRIHKKPAQSRKTTVVDVDLTMDVMRAAVDPSIDGIYLLTGDADFLPLVNEITRRTSKQIYVGAFSSGLAPEMATSANEFLDLDGMFFK